MSFSTSERIPLTGADCFLRAFDYEARRYHGASHLAQLVVRLGPGFDAARFESRLARIVRDHPELRAAVRRPFLVGVPAYHVPVAPDAASRMHVIHRPVVASAPPEPIPVSYTHLTLPTILRV